MLTSLMKFGICILAIALIFKFFKRRIAIIIISAIIGALFYFGLI